jgi:hypothetical protein
METLFPFWARCTSRRISARLGLGLLAVLLAGVAAPTSADPLVIQSGNFGRSGGDPAAFRFVGDDFILSGILFRSGDDLGPYRTCTLSAPCAVGSAIDFSSTFSGPAFPSGPTIFNGEPAPVTSEFPAVVLMGDFRVEGPTLAAPPLGPDDVGRLTAPFSFRGSVIAFAAQGTYQAFVLGPELFRTDLIGSGRANLVLSPRPCTTFDCVPAPPYHVGLFDYVFEPVPEPGTLGLLALGSSVMAAARVLRRRRENEVD